MYFNNNFYDYDNDYRQRMAYQDALERRYRQQLLQKQQQQQREEQQRRRAHWSIDSDSQHRNEENPSSVYQIVRGMDGRLYRVAVPNVDQKVTEQQRQQRQSHNNIVRGPDGRLYRGTIPSSPEHTTSTPRGQNTPSSVSNKASDSVGQRTDTANNTGAKQTGHMRAVQSTASPMQASETLNDDDDDATTSSVLVEDASDSEYEDDLGSLDYTLRNRRPSPGQWMEPVEVAF